VHAHANTHTRKKGGRKKKLLNEQLGTKVGAKTNDQREKEEK
jgi:hypothetical protein